MSAEESLWLQQVIDGSEANESLLVGRFSNQLLARARKSMSDRLRRRLDPEDVIQSVFRSFFTRHRDGQFSFENQNDVWRLLCAMTYRKVARVARFHQQDRRSMAREEVVEGEGPGSQQGAAPESEVIMLDMMDRLLRDLPERDQANRLPATGRLQPCRDRCGSRCVRKNP